MDARSFQTRGSTSPAVSSAFPASRFSSGNPARSASPSPRQSRSPSRNSRIPSSSTIDEKKYSVDAGISEKPVASTRSPSAGPLRAYPTPINASHATIPTPQGRRSSYQTPRYSRPRGLRIANLLRAWLPLIMYALTSLIFVVGIAFYKDELFSRLDDLSLTLRSDPDFGYAVLFVLIFLTTIPPIPLYSTFTVLAGYTFGAWAGAVISYFAALTGAIVVFIVSRTLLRESISRWLASASTIRRVVRAIERRPKLLFLIRLAPYPYNVMNCLLAASPMLTLQTYTICTALSLFKIIIHTSIGASIHSFKDQTPGSRITSAGSDALDNANFVDDEDTSTTDTVARVWTIFGIGLCIAVFVYLSIVARKAVDEELGDDDDDAGAAEERVAFLSDVERGSNDESDTTRLEQPSITITAPDEMTESGLLPPPTSPRPQLVSFDS